MGYEVIKERLKAGGVVILDGGTGTELERRGVPMNAGAWCGVATLDHLDTLEQIHCDYIAAGAQIITANTYASSRLMLREAGVEDQFENINRQAIRTAHKARAAAGKADVLVAGSLSHMIPMIGGAATPDRGRAPTDDEMYAAFSELAQLHLEEGCDLILLEMMYYPGRMEQAFKAACDTGLPVWAGFSARRGDDGEVLSFAQDEDIPFSETVTVLNDFDVAAAGIMHTASNVIGDATAILKQQYAGPLTAYPDSGYFKMPEWQFENIIPPAELRDFAEDWVKNGVQVLGGCCGLSPAHIEAVAALAR